MSKDFNYNYDYNFKMPPMPDMDDMHVRNLVGIKNRPNLESKPRMRKTEKE